ncbi:hypothetical protein MTR67_018226 [Solanum verrucosum]|uniref:Uncharacterized protein n=1 Tax=Solanum verrucosum TaxID=315347 RepID=A0AAF0QKA1_SOLVR|nr:hypothetical protein MTR67_018226 [Solanum verrucosum]
MHMVDSLERKELKML